VKPPEDVHALAVVAPLQRDAESAGTHGRERSAVAVVAAAVVIGAAAGPWYQVRVPG